MALGKDKKSKKSKSSSKKPGRYVTIMQVLQGTEENDDGSDNIYAKANNYKGRLIWQAFGGEDGDDEEDSTFYELKSANIGKPHPESPKFVLQTLFVNLNNPKVAVPIDD